MESLNTGKFDNLWNFKDISNGVGSNLSSGVHSNDSPQSDGSGVSFQYSPPGSAKSFTSSVRRSFTGSSFSDVGTSSPTFDDVIMMGAMPNSPFSPVDTPPKLNQENSLNALMNALNLRENNTAPTPFENREIAYNSRTFSSLPPSNVQNSFITTAQNSFPNVQNSFPTVQNSFPTVQNSFPTVQNSFPTVQNSFPTPSVQNSKRAENTTQKKTFNSVEAMLNVRNNLKFLSEINANAQTAPKISALLNNTTNADNAAVQLSALLNNNTNLNNAMNANYLNASKVNVSNSVLNPTAAEFRQLPTHFQGMDLSQLSVSQLLNIMAVNQRYLDDNVSSLPYNATLNDYLRAPTYPNTTGQMLGGTETVGNLNSPLKTVGSQMFSSPISSLMPTLEPYSIERQAKLHRTAAAICEPTCAWTGTLPSFTHKNPVYSTKVFLGGVPWDITEESLKLAFLLIGNITVEWPGKENSANPPKGYVYVLFEQERHVKNLVMACKIENGNYYFPVSSRRMREKEVQVIPWVISDSNFVRCPSYHLDSGKTIFVGALHGMLSAEALAVIMSNLFGPVVYAGIDTDKHKYPIGSGRVTFENADSYRKAVRASFIEIRTNKFIKRVQVDPYLGDSPCQVCTSQQGPYFCRNESCFKYYCRPCWLLMHGEASSHKPLMRDPKMKMQSCLNSLIN